MDSRDGAAAARQEAIVRSPATKRRNQFRIYASTPGGVSTPSAGASSSVCVPGSSTETQSSQADSESVSESDERGKGRAFQGLLELGRHLSGTFQALQGQQYKEKELKCLRVEANVVA
eukprot:3834247-Rhodomonas_salina.1